MFKNVASQFIVFAFDATTNVPKTGDAANITAYVAIDAGAVTVLGDTSATEFDATNAPGYYWFTAAQAETNGDRLMVTAKSATANIKVLGAPAVIYTRPTTGWLAPTVAARTLDVSAGGEAGMDWANIGSPTTSVALTGTTIAVTQKVDVDTIKTNPVVNAGTVTFPTTATLASTTNITAGTITTVGTLTTYTGNTPQTGDSFARIGAAGVSLTAVGLTGTQTFNNTGTWTGNVVGTVSTLTTYTGNTPQTGDSFARIGAAGASLTSVALTSAYDFAKGTVAVTESYSADGAAPTPIQALMLIMQMLTESSVASTTLTVKKLDGSTSAATFTLNSSTAPTSITRTT